MKKQSWREQKNEICQLIKQISEHYGGDDLIWLRGYANDVIMNHKDDLSVPLACFRDLQSQLSYTPRKVPYETHE